MFCRICLVEHASGLAIFEEYRGEFLPGIVRTIAGVEVRCFPCKIFYGLIFCTEKLPSCVPWSVQWWIDLGEACISEVTSDFVSELSRKDNQQKKVHWLESNWKFLIPLGSHTLHVELAWIFGYHPLYDEIDIVAINRCKPSENLLL